MFRSEGVGICRRFYVTSRGYVERPASFAPPLVDMSNAPPASLHLSWTCRTLRQLRSGSRGYVERSASFAPALVDMSNAPPASLRLSWIYRTLRQLRSAKRGKIDGPTPVYRRFGRGFSTSS